MDTNAHKHTHGLEEILQVQKGLSQQLNDGQGVWRMTGTEPMKQCMRSATVHRARGSQSSRTEPMKQCMRSATVHRARTNQAVHDRD
eukprot:1158578-Pelagomonas_calceolata.AAC.7